MTEEEKTIETKFEVDLAALEHNFLYYKGQLNPDIGIIAMVKAASYGMGAIEVPKLLEKKGVDYFGVAFADEGVLLRNEGIKSKILVMNPGPNSYGALIDHDLEPLVYNQFSLDCLEKELAKRPSSPTVSIHLKLETGMNRLGIQEEELPGILEQINQNPKLTIISALSHLASSSRSENDVFTNRQFEQLRKLLAIVRAASSHEVKAHILNSGGISRFPEARLDFVRLGIGLYGIPTTEEDRKHLKNVGVWYSTISQIKQVKAGDSVGYERAFQPTRNARVAIIPVGYADGFSRHLSNGVGRVKVNGSWVPVVGNVCMDMAFLDVTDIDCQEGDDVILMNEEQSPVEIARQLNTIPYEVLTNIASRVKRVYAYGSGFQG